MALSQGVLSVRAAAQARLQEILADTTGAYRVEPAELVLVLPARLVAAGRLTESRELIRMLEGRVGTDPRYWIELANAHLRVQDKEAAAAAWRRSLQIAPAQPQVAWMLGHLEELAATVSLQVSAVGRYAPGGNTGLQGPYLGQEPPAGTIRVFAPGLLCTLANEYSISFAPDGREIYFSRGGAGTLVCRWESGGWTAPQAVVLDGPGINSEAPDGKYPFFSLAGDMYWVATGFLQDMRP